MQALLDFPIFLAHRKQGVSGMSERGTGASFRWSFAYFSRRDIPASEVLTVSSFHHEFPARCLLDNAYIVAKNVLGVLFLQRFRFFAEKLKKLLPKLVSPPKRALHEKFSISLHLFVFQRFTGKKSAKHHGVFSGWYGCDGHLGGIFDG